MRDVGISYTRVIAMIFILIDHIVFRINIPFKSYIIQITNTGVLIFLFISGFLYGKKEIKNFKLWFLKRAKKILIPLYVFMILLSIIEIIFKQGINILDYLKYLINMQGILGVTDGAIHLWFLTVLMLCYIITPLLNKLKYKIKNISLKQIIIIFIIYFIIQISCAYFINIKFALEHPFSTYLIYLLVYVVGYFYGYFENKEVSDKKVMIFTIIMMISMIIRVISNKLIDGTILYDRIISMYTNVIFALWLSVFIRKYYTIINYKVLEMIINKLDLISFEVYIIHGLAIELFINITNNVLINVSLTLIGIYVMALLFSKVCSYVSNLFSVKISK